MHIQIIERSAYGRINRYVQDEDQANALKVLTRTQTLTEEHINALLALGHTVSVQRQQKEG